MSAQQSEQTTHRHSGPESATEELFAMADCIRDDGLYDVSITDWEKVPNEEDRDQVRVIYQTPMDGEQDETYPWPSKPDEENEFIKTLMVALDLSDPVEAISRADALRAPGGDETGATVPAEGGPGWELKPAADESDTADVAEQDHTISGYYSAMLISAFVTPIFAPVLGIVTMVSLLHPYMRSYPQDPNWQQEAFTAGTLLGTIGYGVLFVSLAL